MQNSRNSHWLENGSLLGWLHLNVEADASVSPEDFVSGRNKFHFSFLQLHSNLARSWVKEKLLHHQGLHLIHKIKLDDSHFKKLVSLFHSGKILQKICLRASWLQLLMKLMISTQIKNMRRLILCSLRNIFYLSTVEQRELFLVLCQPMIILRMSDKQLSKKLKFHQLALLVALVSCSSNFHHWPLLALLVALMFN